MPAKKLSGRCMSIPRCAARSWPSGNNCHENKKPERFMLPYTTYLIDLDGVIYRGNELLPGARAFVNWLEANHKKYLFLTNNSFATAEQILAKLQYLVISTDNAHLLTAGQAAVQFIARRSPCGTVYVVGEKPLIQLVQSQGLSVVDLDAQQADAVLVGLDRGFDYKKMTHAANIVRAG